MSEPQKKRCANYTQEEKDTLIDIVEKFKDVVECKRTGGYYIQKKKEVWLKIMHAFNSTCTTGIREVNQLRHLYDNLKHRARKVTASENKQNYLSLISNDKPVSTNNLQKIWSCEKKEIKKTGGGPYNPVLNEADHRILAILDSQIKPDVNPYDDAAVYFGDQLYNTNVVEMAEIVFEENTLDKVDGSTSAISAVNPVLPTSSTNLYTTPKQTFLNRVKKIKNKKNIKVKSAESLKRIYFKKKIQNACRENRYIQTKQRLLVNEHALRLEILKLEKAATQKKLLDN